MTVTKAKLLAWIEAEMREHAECKRPEYDEGYWDALHRVRKRVKLLRSSRKVR